MSCVQADARLVLDADGAAAQVLSGTHKSTLIHPHPHPHTSTDKERQSKREASPNIATLHEDRSRLPSGSSSQLIPTDVVHIFNIAAAAIIQLQYRPEWVVHHLGHDCLTASSMALGARPM
ncbi:uncharacterized protein BP5553_05294 [Venustampulla echinocandica]|uniref:Uncharacterized protein n=1 Tax=Venustampulla echinocandica TaxID=2656787 RepID=A0A370TQQ1_9HELO|nr:uncharacterized protein BP5553_05294 [Venustampulla echinocandica]RDL37861.1 hypothetical protein BP5553_05294 [Venustampulla echinocandica]